MPRLLLLLLLSLLLFFTCTGNDNPIGIADDNMSFPTPATPITIFPNPTDTVTTLGFGIADSSYVRFYVQNPVGFRLYTVLEETLSAGNYSREWDLSSDAGKKLRNGLYFVTLEIPDQDYRQSKVLEIY